MNKSNRIPEVGICENGTPEKSYSRAISDRLNDCLWNENFVFIDTSNYYTCHKKYLIYWTFSERFLKKGYMSNII